MGRFLKTVAVAACMTMPLGASAEPIKLKLSYFSSDRTMLYLADIKPFVDAINEEAKGLLEIEVYFSGALNKSQVQQVQLVRDGTADLAYIVPGLTAEQFPDNAVIELPGLFRDQREASLVFSRLINSGALRGYEDFFVVSAFASEPHAIHTRKPVASLDDLKGMTIRANNPTEVATFAKLGMNPSITPLNQIASAISRGEFDGAAIPPVMLSEFGVGRLTSYHYLIHADTPALALVMNRKVFDALPEAAKAVISKHSGEQAVARTNKFFAEANAKALRELQEDPRRSVIIPSAADRVKIDAAFHAVIDEWAAKGPRNKELLAMVQKEIEKLRAPVGMAPQ